MSSYLFPEMFSILFNWLPPGFCYENSDNIEGASDDQLLLVPDKVSQELQEEDDEEGSLFLQGDFSGILLNLRAKLLVIKTFQSWFAH